MPTTKNPSGEPSKPTPRTAKAAADAAQTVSEVPQASPRRARKTEATATAPEPIAVAPAPAPKQDRTLIAAVAFVAAVALFAVGFGIGRASNDGASHVVVGADQQGNLPGAGPFGDRGRPNLPFPERPDPRGGGGFLPGPCHGPGPDNRDQSVPPEISGQAFLGIAGFDAPPGGVKVTQVQPGSGAAVAGLEVGDRIVTVDDSEISGMDDLAGLIGVMQPGTVITIGVDRAGEDLTLTATLGSRAD